MFDYIWINIGELIKNKKIIASHLVRVELEKKQDELLEHLNQYSSLFVQPTEDEQKVVTTLVNHPNFDKWGTTPYHKADPFIVALAKVCKITVVTYEKLTAIKNSIPAACRELDVECITFLEFIRKEQIKPEK